MNNQAFNEGMALINKAIKKEESNKGKCDYCLQYGFMNKHTNRNNLEIQFCDSCDEKFYPETMTEEQMIERERVSGFGVSKDSTIR